MDKDSLSDERLASLHQQKRLNGFFIIYNRYQNYGTAIVFRVLEHENLVNALKDEKECILYESIMLALSTYKKSKGSFRQLLQSIIRNQTLYKIRNFRKDPISDYISLDEHYKDDNNLYLADSMTFADKDSTPPEVLNISEQKDTYTSPYIGAHKRKIQKIIELRNEGFSYHEIAKRYATTDKAIRSLLYRVRIRNEIKDSGKIKK